MRDAVGGPLLLRLPARLAHCDATGVPVWLALAVGDDVSVSVCEPLAEGVASVASGETSALSGRVLVSARTPSRLVCAGTRLR